MCFTIRQTRRDVYKRQDPKRIEQMIQKYQGKMKFVIEANPYFLYTKPRKSEKDNRDVLELTREMIEDIAGIS